MSRKGLANKHNPYRTNVVDDVTISVGAEAANAIAVSIQTTSRGNNVAERVPLDVWLSDAATGAGLVATAPDGGVAAAAGTVLNAIVAGKRLECLTTAAGLLTLTVTHAAGAKTLYVVVKLPDGSIEVSGAVTFA